MQEARVLGAGPWTDEREPFFELDGRTYTIPKVISSGVALKFLSIQSENELAAIPWLLDTVLGEEAHQALQDSPSLGGDELTWVIEQVSLRVMGTLEDGRGKSQAGTRK